MEKGQTDHIYCAYSMYYTYIMFFTGDDDNKFGTVNKDFQRLKQLVFTHTGKTLQSNRKWETVYR